MLPCRLIILLVLMGQVFGGDDDVLAIMPTSHSLPGSFRLLLTLADGDLVLLDAPTGEMLWRLDADQAVIVTVVDPPGTPIAFAEHAVIPGLDGTLFFDRGDHPLDPVQVSIKELVDRAPFQTRDGTRFLSQKQTEVVMVDLATGAVRYRLHSGDPPTSAFVNGGSGATILVGLSHYTISAIRPGLAWNLTYTETVALHGDATAAAAPSAALLRLYSSVDGHLWARDSQSGRVLWRTALGVVTASALAVADTATAVKLPVRYGDDDGVLREPVVFRLRGTDVVVANAVPVTKFLHPFDPLLAIAAPPPATAAALLPPPPPPVPESATGPQRAGDTLQITLNLPESPFRFALVVLATIAAAITIQAAGRRLIAQWLTPSSITTTTTTTTTTTKKKKKAKAAVEADDAAAVAFTVGKIVVRTEDVLGVGSQGTIVFGGMFEGRSVAVKRLQKHLFGHATREIALMIESDSHPAVLRYFAREDDANFIYVAVERCLCSLVDVVTGTAPAVSSPLLTREMRPTSFALRILSDMVAGVEYLHALAIVHKDIKPGNILITDDGAAKIADMGLSLRLDRDRSSFAATGPGAGSGSMGWRAPELLRQDPDTRLTRAVDIFSIGCVLYYVLTRGQHPFGESFERDTNISLGRYNLDRIRHLPEAVDVIQATLSADPRQRPLCTEVLRHPFFWSDEKKLEFLQEVSDRVEAEKPDSVLRTALESQAPRVVGRAWNRAIDAALLDNLGKYRKYQYDSVRDALRVIRNKKNHYRDLPPDVQRALGDYPSGFLFYFMSRFPSLLLYAFAFAGRFCAEDAPLSRHFVGLSEPTLLKHWEVWGGAEPRGPEPRDRAA